MSANFESGNFTLANLISIPGGGGGPIFQDWTTFTMTIDATTTQLAEQHLRK